MTAQDISRQLAEKTFKELAQPPKVRAYEANSRNWQDPEGFRYLFPWSNLVLLRHLIRLFTQASLEEVKGDVRELTDDGFLKTVPGSNLAGIGISLKDFNFSLRKGKGNLEEIKGNLKDVKDKFLYRPLTVLYPPLKNVRAQDLTYEILIELINKTDYLLRNLVVSLENEAPRANARGIFSALR